MPRDLNVTAETDDRLVMALAHNALPVHGVQFHPESIASEHGHLMLRNFLDLADDWNIKAGRRRAAAHAAKPHAAASPGSRRPARRAAH
jgi:anthranilate synthase component 2